MVVEWIAIVLSLGAIGFSIWTWKKSRIVEQKNVESSSMLDLMTLLVNTEIKNCKRDVSFWYWNRKDRGEPVYFKNTKYEESARKIKNAFNNAAMLFEQDLINKKNFSEIFGGTLVRFWRILKDDILDIQENKPDFCKHFQKVAEELMQEYSIVGEPYRTNPLLPDN